MAVLVIICGFMVLKYAWRVAVWVIVAPFKLIEAASISLERSRKERARRLAQIEKERARRIAAEQRERLRIEQAARREQREQEQRERARIKAARDAVKWEWAQEREQERRKAAAWRECCNKSKMGLDYQIAIDNGDYRKQRGEILTGLLEMQERELDAAIAAENTKQIEKAWKSILNTRRLIRENEKAVYTDTYNKNKYAAYCKAGR